MNRIFIIVALIGLTIGISQAYAIKEDQSFICKHTYHTTDKNSQFDKVVICTIVNDDNVFTKSGSETIMTQFKYDLDTFDSIYLGEID